MNPPLKLPPSQLAKPINTPPFRKSNPYKDIFKIDKVGTGKYFTKGQSSSFWRGKRGIEGELSDFKKRFKHTAAKNTSWDDLHKFEKIIGDKLSRKKTFNSRGFTRKDKWQMVKKVTKLVKQGDLSRADRKDFKEIVASLNESLSQKEQSPLASSPNNTIAKHSLSQLFPPNSNPLSSNHSNPNNLTDMITKKVNLDETNETRKVKINPTTEIIDNLVPPAKKITSDEAIDLPID